MHRLIYPALLLVAATAFAQPAQPPHAAWKAMQPLIGEWVGEGGGKPGQASAGGFTFALDLQGSVLVRRSFSEYPAAPDRPAARHDDLTIVTRGSAGSPPRATYYDNEGHVIEYAVSASPDGSRIEWLGAVRPGEPRFRFTYVFTAPDALKMRFEIAPPGQPEAFQLYVEASARRKR
jgi:hypothetical protein